MALSEKAKFALLHAVGDPTLRDEIVTAADAATDIDTGEMNQNVLKYADVTIAHAALLTLGATPVTLVAAPGSGYALDFVSAYLYYDYATAAYTLVTETVDVEYGSNATVLAAVLSNAELVGTADVRKNMRAAVANIAPVDNSTLQLTTSGNTNPAGGNASASLKVRVYYRIIPFSL